MSNKNSAKTDHSVWVVIPAAGSGKRMQLDLPKQYLKINNKAVIEHTLECFLNHKNISGIVVALDGDDFYWKGINLKQSSTPIYTVEGGIERVDSVKQALDYLRMVEQVSDDNWVMVHDAARPCLTANDLDALLMLREGESIGGLLASPVRDTMKRSETGRNIVKKTESRENLWHALTPQMFRLGMLNSAIEYCLENDIQVTDEASAIESKGGSPSLIEGSHSNIKITFPEDVKVASALLAENRS